jgi:SAM-dependent methyltransferase
MLSTMGPSGPSISYWDGFYCQGLASDLAQESLFAAKFIESISPKTLIFDIGCGTGRDAKYFRNLGYDVVAIDGSVPALETLQNTFEYFEFEKNMFKIDFSNEDEVKASIRNSQIRNMRFSFNQFVIYNRFFLHSISMESQQMFLWWCAEMLTQGEEIYSEFRSPLKGITYEFGSHFRREMLASDFEEKLRFNGFKNMASQSSLGFAPYKNERPLVTRTWAQK